MNDIEPTELQADMAPDHFVRGLKDAVPIMLGFVPFALVLGAQAVQKGSAEVALMTGLNFGGGSEFAALALWTSPPQIALIVAVALLVNSRHLLMGAAFAPLMRGLSRRKAFLVLFFMCDESWAMGLDDARRNRTALNTRYFFGVAIGLYSSWIVFTTVGLSSDLCSETSPDTGSTWPFRPCSFSCWRACGKALRRPAHG